MVAVFDEASRTRVNFQSLVVRVVFKEEGVVLRAALRASTLIRLRRHEPNMAASALN